MEYQKIIYPKDYTQKMGNTLMASEKTSQLQATDLTYMGLCTALIAICSWISIPASVPFTLQTFAIFTTLGWCVFPFILPDLCKIALALTLTRQLRRFIKQ